MLDNIDFSYFIAFILTFIFIIIIFYKRLIENIKRLMNQYKQPINEDNIDDIIRISGYSYDERQDIFYSNIDAWQRKMGYCRLYDEAAAPMGMIIDCEPIYFKYNEEEWLIEFWKGQYDLSLGGEIGFYKSIGPDLNIDGVFNGSFYKAVSNEDFIHMSFILKKNNRTVLKRKDEH